MSKQLTEIEFDKKIKTIKFLTSACVGAGGVKVVQMAMPTIAKTIVSAKAVTTGAYVIGGTIVPYYFIFALLIGASTPTITEFIKSHNERKNRKAEDVKNNECFMLED